MPGSDSVLDDILAAAELLSVSDTAPPSPPDLARTPVTRGATRRGGGSLSTEGTVPLKLCSVVDIDCCDTSYCFGIIKNGSAFCIKKGCTTKTHASNKMPFAGCTDSFVFIRRNIPGSVFSDPKLLSSKIPDDAMTEWQSKVLSTDDWTTEFQAIDGTSEPLTSAEEIQTETDFPADSMLLRTPAKRRKDSFAGEEYEGIPLPAWKNRKFARSLPEDPQDLEAMIDEGINKGFISTAVSKIETYMGDVLDESNAIHHERLVNLEGNLEIMIGVLQTMKARIGNSVDIGEKFAAPTLWASTAFIADDLSKVTESVSTLQTEVVVPMKETVATLMKNDEDLTMKTDKVVRAVGSAHHAVRASTSVYSDSAT